MKAETQCVKSNLGLVCITTTDAVRYKTVTRKRLLSFDERVQQEMLRVIYQENINRINNAIKFCAANDINLYRLTSGLFPFSDEPIGAEILEDFAEQLSVTGRKATANNLRIVMHPDQYVVLSSDSESVVENSVKILKMHAKTLDLLEQPRSEWATMNIHGGKGDRADKLVESVEKLPFEIRSRIAFENDEHAYSSSQILEVCRRASVPMVFDAHHHVCREKLDNYNHESVAEMFWAARETWANPENQLVHISNGRDYFQDRAHHDLIFTMPEVFRFAPWIEIEAKHKEIAIEKLKNEWLNV
ncbi:MAG: UV DNA damage repair endonuclease UvsE [Acidobacteria bacterium]|jgi:UV DNA damage endonuclease|nr:UV DNA damage repair endonuclease UvsE [Acidobacteriota bacterium]